ncbi:MAG TPA: SDR family oxidoreductase [Caulobacteraceae bacterium]|nr:SDR family oxidoreductase [Caulobacteraceae bacterium]
MAGRLAGKVAIITGASRGLGQYCAVGYGREGAKVVVAARTEVESDPRLPGTIHDTVRMVKEAGGEAIAVVCNVADMDSVEAMAARTLDTWGRVDILMTNAAVQPAGFISTIKPKSWELEFNINVHGPFRCIRAVLPAMQEQKSGAIINISSVAARGGSHYGATKRAIEAMTIGLARELKDQGIAVNAMKPVGGIETPGLLFGRPQGAGAMAPAPGQNPTARPAPQAYQPGSRPNLPSPDSYVEAAVLLAMQTPDSFTGQVYNDAQLIERLASAADKARFRAENPPNWVEAMTAE